MGTSVYYIVVSALIAFVFGGSYLSVAAIRKSQTDACTGWGIAAVVSVIVLIVFAIWGPTRFTRTTTTWKQNAYGGDFLVIQYNAYMEPVRSWKLEGVSIGNEKNSDGIVFQLPGGKCIMHLGGQFYNYVQVMNKDWDTAVHELTKCDMQEAPHK